MRKIVLLATAAVISGTSGLCQHFNMPEELRALQYADTSDSALAAIEQELPKNLDLKKEITNTLPRRMREAPNGTVLANESVLAGQLKIVACIPQLLAVYLKGDIDGRQAVTLTRFTRLQNDPAGYALVQMGDPVIESVKGLLSSPDQEVRRKAVLVLANIASPSAMEVLKQHRPEETDEYLQRVIDHTPTKEQSPSGLP